MPSWGRALDALMRERGRDLYAYAHALTGHVGSADVLLEDALVEALRRRRPRGVSDSYARTLTAMRRALAHDRHRPPPGGPESGAGPSLDEIADAPEHRAHRTVGDGAGNGSRPEDDDAAQLHRAVASARAYVAEHPLRDEHDPLEHLLLDIAALPAPQRVCLVMRYLDDLGADAIAHEVDLEPDAVRGLLRDAVETLRERQPGLGLDPDDAADGGSEYIEVSGR
ncbi:RNA polymerase sigma factor [Demequina pelophila]|uniref:RNA polymerase sigma factor n=1 Tax=Demequina pelophila TaxID=1638984 RepID=UPI0007847528|nr:hypothetical protein [Demequina pelophila]